jgi:hypothetical protein
MYTGADPTSRIRSDAARIRAPVLFHVQWQDELFPKDGQLALFDLLRSPDKQLIAYSGPHGETRPEATAAPAKSGVRVGCHGSSSVVRLMLLMVGRQADIYDPLTVVKGSHRREMAPSLAPQMASTYSKNSRDGGICTRDPLTPSQVRYQAALRPGTARPPPAWRA